MRQHKAGGGRRKKERRSRSSRWVIASLLLVIAGDAWSGAAPPQVPIESLHVSHPEAASSPVAALRAARAVVIERAPAALAAESQVPAQRPTSIDLPGGFSMRIDVAVTRKDGTLGLPSDIYRAGWWDGSSRLGDPYGAIVVAAHVDSLDAGLGPFANLLEVRSGHTVRLVGPSISQEFRVVSVTFQPRVSLSERPETLAPHGDQRLVLITCGGPFDADHGGYRDNVIVTAAPRGAPQPLRR